MAGIAGSITNSSAGYTISTVCPVDWALAYGDPPSVGFVRKSGGGSTITITDGAGSAYTTTDYYHPAAVTWTGGDAVSTGTENWSFTSTNGARVVFPADTTERVVRIYWGTYYDGTSPAIDVTATLSDASAGPWEPANHSVGSGTDGAGYIEITYSAGSASQTLTVTIAGVDAGSTAITRLQAAGTISSTELASRDQEGFRFGVDDDTESAHTWAAAQDANLTAPLDTNTLLRVLVDATGDPASTAYTLRYQKGGAGGYVAVPVGASSSVSPPQVTSATVQSITTAKASWALTNGRPAASTGDMIVAVVAWDDSTTVSSVTPPAGPNSESAVSIAGPIASASTEMRMQAWYWIATGSWTLGNWTYTPAASETCRQAAFVIPAGQFNAADPIGWANTSASTGTAESTLNSPTGTAEANDGGGRLFIAYGSDVDAITAPASGTTTVNNGRTGGVGLCIVSRDTVVANSESIAAISATITSDSWAALGFVVKPATVTNELYISASANIAAGGEATTARLTAPSGKTTGDFVTGRRWDDENGTDTIDITADDYTELEWCLKAVSPAEDDDYYEFRVYAGSNALDTYTVTPKWTIGTLGAEITPAAGALELTGYAPSADRTAHQVVVPGAGAVVLVGAEPVIVAPVVITPDAGALTISGSAPTVSASAAVVLTPDAGAVVLTGASPGVSVTSASVLTPGAGALTLTGSAPDVAQTAHKWLTPDAGAVALAGSAPDVGLTANRWLTPDAGAVALAGAAPTVAVTQSGVISPAAGGLTLTGYAPVQTLTIPAPAPAVLTLTGHAPTVTVTQSGVISPAAGALTLTGFAPTLAATGNVAITPAAGVVALAGAAPVVARTAHRWLTPGAGAVVIGGAAPSVSVSAHRSIVPDAGALTLTGYAPNFAFTSPVIVPANAEIVITGYAPNVIAIRRDRGGAGRSKRRRVIIGERLYNVLERDIPALIEAELLDRAPPVTAEVIEGPKPPRKRAKKAPQPVKTVEQVRETVQQIKARIEPDDAWLAQALEAVAFRVLERLQDEEDSLMLLLAA